ncbi:MAG: hypothetical protein WD739_07370 [Actinomycetota bacterium]
MPPKPKTVRARYLGGPQIVMPDLVGARPDKAEAEQEWIAKGRIGLNPAAVVNQGDVVELPAGSVEGREDFEIVKTRAKPKKTARKRPRKKAAASSSEGDSKPAAKPAPPTTTEEN